MSDRTNMKLAAQMGPKSYKQAHAKLTVREKLALARDERALLTQRADELQTARRTELVNSGWMPDDEVRRQSEEVRLDLADFDAAIAEMEKQLAVEETADRQAAEQTAEAAEVQRQAERKQARAQAGAKLDDAFAQVEAAYKAWLAEQRDLPVQLQNRRHFYLRAALCKLAPELATALAVARVPHSHQRPLAEVTQ